MRIALQIDSLVEAIANGNKPYLKEAAMEIYNLAYREGYDDAKADCAETEEQEEDEE